MATNKDLYGATSKTDLYRFDPEAVRIVDDPDHELYDERIHRPLIEATVLLMMEHGVLEPVLFRKAGTDDDGAPIVEIVDGRRRTLHLREANARLIAAGRPPHLLPGIPRRETGVDLQGLMAEANEHRESDPPMVRARKMQKLLTALIDANPNERQSAAEKVVARRFRCGVQSVKNALALLDLHPDLQALVDRGKLGSVLARRVAGLPIDEQRAELAKVAATTDASRTGDYAAEEAAKPITATAAKAALDRNLGGKGKVRARTVRSTAERRAFIEDLQTSKSEACRIAAAAIAWTLGDPDAFEGFAVLKRRAAGFTEAE